MSVYSIIFSPTGGTKKVADLFVNAFAGEYTEIDLTDAFRDFSEAVCPVQGRKVAQPVIDFLNEKLTAGAKGYKENQLFL